MATHSDALTAVKARLRDLGQQKDAAEKELAEIVDRLDRSGAGLKGSLLDKEVRIEAVSGAFQGQIPGSDTLGLWCMR